MPVTEESRHRLHQTLDRTIGEEEATTLMEHLPPVGWADVATKTDLATLQTAIDARFEAERAHVDHRFAMVELRIDAAVQRSDDHFATERARTDGRFDLIDQRFTDLDTHLARTFGQIDARLASIDARLGGLDARLGGLEGRFSHQFWQFLGIVLAIGAIAIGISRYG